MFNSSQQVSSLRKLLISYSSINTRQTVFASASIPQHRRFLYDCIQQKWTKVFYFIYIHNLIFHFLFNVHLINIHLIYIQKANVVHIHANPIHPMPPRLHHRFLVSQYKFSRAIFYDKGIYVFLQFFVRYVIERKDIQHCCGC